MGKFHILDILVIILYFIGMIAVGIISSKKVKDSDSYATADHSLSFKVMVGTSIATCLGASNAIGQPGMTWEVGMASLLVLATWHCGWLVLLCFAKRLRASGATTLPDFLSMRFGKSTKVIASLITLVFLISSTAAQTAAVARILEGLGLLKYETAVIVSGLIIILYTVFGGLYAVAVSDTIQAVLLIGGIGIAMPVVAFAKAGGVGYVFANSSPEILRWDGVAPKALLGWVVAYIFAAGSQPAYIQRILASKDEKTAFWGSLTSNIICLFFGCVIAASVVCMPFLFPNLNNGELWTITAIFNLFPPVIRGAVMAALIGLVMSTADSFLLLIGTTASSDVCAAVFPELSKKKLLTLSRIFVVVGGLLGIGLSLGGTGVLKLFKTGAAAYGAGLFIPMVCACYWKKATTKAVNIGMIVGCITTIGWNLSLKSTGIDGVIIGVICCFVCVIAVSMADGTSRDVSKERI